MPPIRGTGTNFYYGLGLIRMQPLLPLQGTGMNKFIYRIQVQINYGFGWIRILPLQATGTNKLQIWPELAPTCTGFRYEFITDLAESGSYLYRILIKIN
jgi:hypothetical protein